MCESVNSNAKLEFKDLHTFQVTLEECSGVDHKHMLVGSKFPHAHF